MHCQTLEHRFVKHIPDALDQGILYVSMEYGSVAHSCCCGCAEEVITPLTPTDWNLIFDGETISLSPSVGSWTLPCRSHYVIRRSRVRWAGSWTEDQIEAERNRDHLAKAKHYRQHPFAKKGELQQPKAKPAPKRSKWFRRFWRKLLGS